MNSTAYDNSKGGSIPLNDFGDDCETFLERYSRGNIHVGELEPPELEKLGVPTEVLMSGDLPAPLPPDDNERVRELYQYHVLRELNHDAKLRLDRFLRVGSLVCDAKICIIDFIDDKSLYTSAEVAPSQWLLHSTIDKRISMCAHSILQRSAGVFEVPDTTQDWRFRGKPYVAGEPYIRYYAGTPLRTESGYNIGSLCVLDYVPKRLTDHQKIALKDLAKMIMADLELYRGKEMSGLKERMAFSITQFTRGPSKIHRQPTEPNAHRSNTLDRVRRHNGDDGYVPLGWKKRSPSADRSLSKESEGVMNYYGLTVDQQTVDSLLSPEPGNNESASTTAGADSPVGEEDAESTDSKQDEVNLRTIYRYACRLMRETLDIEGVCIIEIDWEYLTGALKYRNDNNVDRDAPSHHDGKFDASSVVLGYSHSHQFGTIQRESWQPIKGWDDETLISINPINGGKRSRIDQSRHRVFTATDLSAGRDNLAAGRLSDHFVAGFISENVSGKLFNNGLPEAVSKFLPPTAAGAILVPLYDFDHRPFAITCAYSTDKHKKFLEEERQYLEAFGSGILSQALKERIILADRSKGIFISNISHELRSPLHGILASAEFISDTYLNTLQRTFIDSIDTCGRTLLEVINHVLDFGKLTYMARLKGKVSRPQIQNSNSIDVIPRVNASTTDLIGIVEQTVESCCAVYEFKGISEQIDMGAILGETDPEFSKDRFQRRRSGRAQGPLSALTVIIDVAYHQEGWLYMLQSGAIQRILKNIIGNALKYTSAGWVRIQVSAKKVKGEIILQFIVSDSGKGISATFQQSRLFNPFAQEDILQSGTGLGMSIVKQIVQHLGGEIKVSSQVGVGTRVQITLPGEPELSADSDDSCSRVRSRTTGKTVYLAGFERTVPASRLLYESIANYVTSWYQMEIVGDVSFADLIISNECPELLKHFRRTSSPDSQAFNLFSTEKSPTNNVYHAKQPLIVLCSNAWHEFFGFQPEPGKVIDFSSKPCGPYKLARSILFCLESQETVDGAYGGADRVQA